MSEADSPQAKAEWSLTGAALERLLGALDSDRDRAAEAYEQLRARIAGLHRWWGAANGEALADVTLDRVARKLEEGADIGEGSFGAYVRGVARMVYHEAIRQEQRVRASELGAIHLMPAGRDETSGPAFTCLDKCLPQLAEQDRKLVLRYYGEGKKNDVRRQLAAELGISSTALRIRTCRLRERLERCVKGCLAAS